MKAPSFNPKTTRAARAVQAWLVLISKAMNRQTIHYKDLGRLMFEKKAAGVLSQILGHIAYWCSDHNLPPLNAIVVGANRGRPGRYIPTKISRIDRERERVYRRNWYVLRPPSEAALVTAWKKRHP